MENASKALVIAGSVLMALMVLGAVMLMYNRLANFEQTKTNIDESSKLTNYNHKFEQYNRTIYGSELLSLANLSEDYNKTQSELKGYQKVSIDVKITKEVEANETTYVSTGSKKIEDILKGIKKLEDDIKEGEKETSRTINGKRKNYSLKKWAQMSKRQIAEEFGISIPSNTGEDEIKDKLKNAGATSLLDDLEKYSNLKTTYTAFKNSKFKCEQTGNDDVGRLNKMKFTEL